MDDDRTREAINALGDLFLTGIGGAESPGDAATATEPDEPDPPDLPDSPNPLDGPTPIRLAPKVSARNDGLEPQDRGPVRTSGPTTESKQPEDQADGVLLEGVFLGNLPGTSGPWLTQYAGLIAREDGPVVVLHVGDGQADLEVVESTGGPARSDADRDLTRLPEATSGAPLLIGMLEALVRDEVEPVRTVLVHVEPSGGNAEARRLEDLNDWTLLCGTDETAVVGAYRTLKQLIERNGSTPHHRVGVMIMGSDQDASRAAANRIRSAAASFLRTPVQLVGWQKQMVPVKVRQLGTFSGLDSLWPWLCDWFDTLDPPAFVLDATKPADAPLPAESEPIDPPGMPATPVPADHAVRRDQPDRAFIEAEVSPETLGAPRKVQTPIDRTPTSAKPTNEGSDDPVSRPAAAPEPEPAVGEPNAGTADLDLAAFAAAGPGAILGVIRLDARCPRQPRIRLVLDQDGRLHMLGWTGDSPENGPSAVRATIIDLIGAREWAREHMKILGLTHRQCRFDPDSEPALHLFTDRADLAIQVVARLGQTVKLHLLQPVSSEQSWLSVPLS